MARIPSNVGTGWNPSNSPPEHRTKNALRESLHPDLISSRSTSTSCQCGSKMDVRQADLPLERCRWGNHNRSPAHPQEIWLCLMDLTDRWMIRENSGSFSLWTNGIGPSWNRDVVHFCSGTTSFDDLQSLEISCRCISEALWVPKQVTSGSWCCTDLSPWWWDLCYGIPRPNRICQASLSHWGWNWRNIVLWPDTGTTAKVSHILRKSSQPAERIQSRRACRGETVLGDVWHEASQRLAGKCIVRKGKHRLGSFHRQKSSHKLRVNSFSSDPKDLQ